MRSLCRGWGREETNISLELPGQTTLPDQQPQVVSGGACLSKQGRQFLRKDAWELVLWLPHVCADTTNTHIYTHGGGVGGERYLQRVSHRDS